MEKHIGLDVAITPFSFFKKLAVLFHLGNSFLLSKAGRTGDYLNKKKITETRYLPIVRFSVAGL